MKLSFPQITYIFDRYHKSSDIRKGTIELRITYNRKQKYISTGISVFPYQWSNQTIVNTEDSIILNKSLDKLLTDVRQVIYSMSEEGTIDIFSIPIRLQQLRDTKISFLDYCRRRIKIRKYGKARDTQERYDRFLEFLEGYKKIRDFSDITEDSIIELDRILSKKKLKVCSKWHNYHRFMNSFINDAIGEGIIKRNPYKWVNIPKSEKTESLKKCLTPEEFDRIKEAVLPTDSLNRVRDLFIFQTYTCLAYTDLRDFNKDNIIEVKRMKVYIGGRNKTHKDFTIPIVKQAMDILDKYGGVLPIISNVKYNLYLKTLAQYSGIDKQISSHWARHTGATILINEGVDLKIISKICGHSSINITEKIYARLLNTSIVDAVTQIEDKI